MVLPGQCLYTSPGSKSSKYRPNGRSWVTIFSALGAFSIALSLRAGIPGSFTPVWGCAGPLRPRLTAPQDTCGAVARLRVGGESPVPAVAGTSGARRIPSGGRRPTDHGDLLMSDPDPGDPGDQTATSRRDRRASRRPTLQSERLLHEAGRGPVVGVEGHRRQQALLPCTLQPQR